MTTMLTAPDLACTVTSEQVERAVIQLRERRGQPAAEQVQAVLHALELTVVPAPNIPRQRHSPGAPH